MEEEEENQYDNEDFEDDEDESDDEEEDLESDDEIDEDDDEPHHHPTQPIKQEQEQQQPAPPAPDQKHQPATTTTTATPPQTLPPEDKKPLPIDDSRKLFQRLWTDEDEIGLLQGFYEYTSQRGGFKNSAYHHDTAPFYDQIKSRLQLDFNKNQLVEKLRRLKKKYRNAMARVNSGKDLSFKTPHEQATFQISKKIWCDIDGAAAGVEDEYHHVTPIILHGNDTNGSPSSSRKRSRTSIPPLTQENVLHHTIFNSSLSNVIEETVKSSLVPLFKEVMHSAVNGRGFGSLNPLGVNFGMTLLGGLVERELMDDKWRKQQILELEVYSKRAELVQEQIKLALEDLRSHGNE